MPSIRDISVHVTDGQDVQLEEWGVQHLRTRTKQDKVSAYIKATTGISFRILIEAKIPYTDYNSEDAVAAGMEDLEEYRGFHPRRAQGYIRPFSRSHGHHRSQDLSSYRNRDSGSGHGYWPSTTPYRPPFDLLATLYLDGREKAERKVIVYLDPDYEDFNPGTGYQTSRSIIKSRWVQGHDGMIHEHAWVFKDIGIETRLDKMALTSEADSMAAKEEDAIIDALGRTGIHPEDDMTREEKHRVGQIEVAITRIVLGRKRIDSDFRPKHREGEDEDVGMGKMKPEVTHTAAFAPLRTLSRRGDVPVISYEPYDDDNEEPFAVFKFFYRSQETLEKFNFPGFVPLGKKPVRSNRVNAHLNHITPLGISRGFTSTSKSKRVEGEAFEDTVKRGGFKTVPAPYFNYDNQNRRVLSADAQESSHLQILQAQPSTDSDAARATNEWHDTSIESSSTSDGYQAAPVNNHSVNEPGTSFLPRNARSLTVTNNTLRNEISSDADDEHDPASDLETLAGGDDDDDDGQNMDKDDEGLHKDMNEHLNLGKRTRGSDGSSPQDEETGTKHYNTEEEHSPAEDNGKKKRVKRDGDATYKLTGPDPVK